MDEFYLERPPGVGQINLRGRPHVPKGSLNEAYWCSIRRMGRLFLEYHDMMDSMGMDPTIDAPGQKVERYTQAHYRLSYTQAHSRLSPFTPKMGKYLEWGVRRWLTDHGNSTLRFLDTSLFNRIVANHDEYQSQGQRIFNRVTSLMGQGEMWRDTVRVSDYKKIRYEEQEGLRAIVRMYEHFVESGDAGNQYFPKVADLLEHLKISVDFWLHCLWMDWNDPNRLGPPRRRVSLAYTDRIGTGRDGIDIHAVVHDGDSPFDIRKSIQRLEVKCLRELRRTIYLQRKMRGSSQPYKVFQDQITWA